MRDRLRKEKEVVSPFRPPWAEREEAIRLDEISKKGAQRVREQRYTRETPDPVRRAVNMRMLRLLRGETKVV